VVLWLTISIIATLNFLGVWFDAVREWSKGDNRTLLVVLLLSLIAAITGPIFWFALWNDKRKQRARKRELTHGRLFG
jgi:magnesium-transporting ATPase (P-type)